MKALTVVLTVLGIYALAQVTIQSFRHAYILWVEPRGSVLYEQVGQDVLSAKTLDELFQRYKDATRKVEEWERGKSDEELQRADRSREPYQTQQVLRAGIEAWEGQRRQLSALHFYWWCGLVTVVVGAACYRRSNRWIGAALLIAGLAEMVWWTSPTFRILSAEAEFGRLLWWKLIYSIATFVGLILLAAGATRMSRTSGYHPAS